MVQAALALRPELRHYQQQIEHNQRLPPPLVEQLHAAGFYRLVMPRSLGGLQADPLTFIRVVELLAEGVGSVGWNVANNGVGQLVTLGLPDEGVQEIYASGPPSVIAGTAVQGGGQAVPVTAAIASTAAGPSAAAARRAPGCWAVSRSSTPAPRRRPDGGSCIGAACSRAPRSTVIPGSWDVTGMRGTGSFDWTVKDLFLPERRTMPHAGVPLDNQWARWPGITYALPSLPGSGRTTAR